MDLRSASTARGASRPAPSDAQENQEPVQVEISGKTLFPASGAPNKSKTDPINRKLRRALHSIDSNRPRPSSCSSVNSPQPPLSNAPLPTSKDPIEAKKLQPLPANAATSRISSEEAATALTGHKRPATTPRNETKTPTGSDTRHENENVAWMDMMLALLEKRYGAGHAPPVSLSDLEAANLLQLPEKKRLKTGIAASGSSLDVSREQINTIKTTASGSTNSQQPSARFKLEPGQPKEDKRQRLLLRHAQQIQASSVSSSASCGCKTGCLKMYCMCFSSRGFCHAGCGCEDCKNGRQNKTERVEAIQNYLANDPRAFSFASKPQDASTTGFLHLLPQKSSAVVMRGCRCKKSKCLKKYCECFQNGIACTSHCRCMDCSNHSESTAAHQHPHLHRKDSPSKLSQPSTSVGGSTSSTPKPFHPVQITVTKQPRRNHVGKTLRLNL